MPAILRWMFPTALILAAVGVTCVTAVDRDANDAFADSSNKPACPQFNFTHIVQNGTAGYDFDTALHGSSRSRCTFTAGQNSHKCSTEFCAGAQCKYSGYCDSICKFCTRALVRPLSKIGEACTKHHFLFTTSSVECAVKLTLAVFLFLVLSQHHALRIPFADPASEATPRTTWTF